MKRIACIGAGTVGRAWALVFARAGAEVRLYDAAPGAAAAALPRIVASARDIAAETPGPEAPDADAIAARVTACGTLAEALAGVDWVQESVREDLSIKRAVAAEIAAHAPAAAIIASSTSALRGSTFLGDIPGPERALVAHPVNPPSHIPLVELCGTGLTSEATMAAARAFMDRIGMAPITVAKEIDGFILNRLQYVLVAEALHLVGEGYVGPEDLDRVMTEGLALRWASIGPLMTAHLNAAGGYAGFVGQLEPMMRRIGEDARTDYPWTEDLTHRIHEAMAAQAPVEKIPQAQAWRDRRILRARAMQKTDEMP